MTHLRGLAFSAVFGAPLLLKAQQPPVSDTTRQQLPAVTVVGTRTERSTFALPLAVTVLSQEKLQNLSGTGLDQALTRIPGVLAQSRYGAGDVRITIRGFGARGAGDRSNAGTSRGIRVLTDGIPETEPDGRTSFDFVDLASAEGVEVIRSNASAVWGNAAGGVINISTVPSYRSRFFTAEQMGGSFGLLKSVLNGGTTFGSSKGYFAYTNTSLDGWRDHSSQRRTLLNLGLQGPLGDRTKLGLFVSGTNNLLHIPGPLTLAELKANPEQANPTYAQRDERRYNRLMRVGMKLDHQLGASNEISGMLFVNPKYLQRSERGTFRDFTRYHGGGNLVYRNKSTLGASTRSLLSVGIDEAYQDGAILFYSLSPTNGRGSTLRDNKREGANNLGIFVQEELSFTDQLGIILGARYDDIEYHSESFIDPRLNDTKSFRRVTPKFGAVYRMTPLHSFYANVGGGVEAPAGNETDPAGTFGQDTILAINPLLDPIRSTTYEVGTKEIITFGSIASRTALSYDLALYTTDVRNEIIPYRGGRFYFTAGKVRRSGVELGVDIDAPKGFSLNTAFTYSHNEYREYLVDSVHYDVSKANRFANFAGNEVAGVPDYYYSASLGYAPPALSMVDMNVGVQGVSDFWADDANAVQVPSYNIVNATLALNRPVKLSRNFGVRGFVAVNNLADRKYVASAFINPDVVNGVPVAFEPGLPRNFVVSLSLGWLR